MKSIYSILLPLAILLFTTKCTMTDPSFEEDIDHLNADNNTSAIISIANLHSNEDQLRTAHSNNDMLLVPDEQSITASMIQEEWNSKTVPNTRTTWTNASNTVSWLAGDKVGVYMQSSTGTTQRIH